MSFNMKAVFILGSLVIVVLVLTLVFIIVPLVLTTERKQLKGSMPYFVFFAGIGLGFMFVEISQMQRLIVFLGHPVYVLSVVLFSLLLAGGLGSLSTQEITSRRGFGGPPGRLFALVLVLVVFGFLTPEVVQRAADQTTVIRILLSVVILTPLGFFMGMAFPIGMRLSASQSPQLIPWFWGVNGATSVCASVLSVAVALSFGISTSFWLGVLCYVFSVGALVCAARLPARVGSIEERSGAAV